MDDVRAAGEDHASGLERVRRGLDIGHPEADGHPPFEVGCLGLGQVYSRTPSASKKAIRGKAYRKRIPSASR